MTIAIDKVDVFFFERPRNSPYLGADAGEFAIGDRYIVREFNGTVYPLTDRSIVVRVTDKHGAIGWGETYGLIAPKAVAAIIDDLMAPYLKLRTFDSPEATWDGLYELQRNRGYWGGYLADALAALDIAIWDMHARSSGQSLQAALGKPGSGRLSGYVSGIPAPSKQARLDLVREWKGRGFDRVKLPISHTDNGDVVGEVEFLRAGLGDDHEISVDLHWTLTAQQTLDLGEALKPSRPWFLEAPTVPEDIAAQRTIAEGLSCPLAIGEEWRTEWDYRQRLDCCQIIQPEMGHTGITQFARLSRMAQQQKAAILPHATIGLGIFASASLRSALAFDADGHEFQHTIYTRNAELLDGAAPVANGYFDVPDTPGHGVTPNGEAMQFLTPLSP